MHGFLACQHPVEIFRQHGRGRREELERVDQHVEQCFIGVLFVTRHFLAPESSARAPDIPVREPLDQGLERGGVAVDAVGVHVRRDFALGLVKQRQNPFVKLRRWVRRRDFVGAVSVNIGVGDVEIARVPHGQDKRPEHLLNPRILKPQIPHEHGVGAEQIEPEGVCAVGFHKFHGVGVVVVGFGKLLAVLVQNRPVDHAVFEGGAVKERRRQHVQVVEPAADLPRVLHDKITREVGFEPLLVLKGVVLLRERHAAGLKPAVKDFRDPSHLPAARARKCDFVDILSVQIGESHAAAGLNLVKAPQHFPAVAFRAFPDGDGRAPVAVAGDVPVPRVLKPLPEAVFLHRIGHPVYLFVVFDEPVLELLDV